MGRRTDLLLTLARLSLPDAVRRANQPVAVAALFALLFLLFSTAATLGALPAIFAIESSALRKNLLNLIGSSVTAVALLAQMALRAPVTWLLDLKDLLRLPAGFRDLYGLRFALSTIGYWLPVLGPAGVYLAVTRSGGITGAPITLLGFLTLVWIFGRTAAILSLLFNRWVEGALGALAVVVIMAAVQGAILVWAMALAGGLNANGIPKAIEDSAVLSGLGYAPPGLFVGIVHEPGWSAPNLARLGSLFAVLAVLAALESRLLLRSYVERPELYGRTASGLLPLVRILRRWRRLGPLGVLQLLETEGLLRLKPARLVLAMALGFALVWVPTDAGFAVAMAAILSIGLNELRVGKQPPTCHAWRESLTLPFPVRRIFSAPGRATNMVVLCAIAFILGLTPLDWFGWPFLVVAVCLILAGVLMSDAAYGLIQVHWPQRNTGFIHDLDGSKFAATLVAAPLAFGPGSLIILIYGLQEQNRVTALVSSLIASAVLLLAAAAAYASRRWQARVLRTRGRELLLEDPDEAPPNDPSPS